VTGKQSERHRATSPAIFSCQRTVAWPLHKPWAPSDTGKRGLLVWTENIHTPSGASICFPLLGQSERYKNPSRSTTTTILPPPISLLFRSSILLHPFIYLCRPALSSSTHFQPLSQPVMVASTRPKNKLAHPAAPVMTETAKRKAGIKTNRRPKKPTKDETIRLLQAQIAALENPHEESFSKEPLVCVKP
jgi:hypothetical protein